MLCVLPLVTVTLTQSCPSLSSGVYYSCVPYIIAVVLLKSFSSDTQEDSLLVASLLVASMPCSYTGGNDVQDRQEKTCLQGLYACCTSCTFSMMTIIIIIIR